MEATLNFREKRQTDEFNTPVKSELKIKLNGKKEQKGRFVLQKRMGVQTIFGQRQYNLLPQEKPIKKGNGRLEFQLDNEASYFFIV